MGKIIKDEYILGVRFWALIEPRVVAVPKFTVYRYIGRNEMGDLFWFENIRNKMTITLRVDELNSIYFKPFLIDHKRIVAELEKIDKTFDPW